jgi:citrate lyase subunit beta/citryl-CoA lyase
MIAACRAAGLDAIDGPFANFKDDRAYLKQATHAASLGAVGKWCIHPNQIPLANDVFAPSPREIEQAQKMVDLYHESLEQGAGAGGKGGMLVDAATLRLYQPVLDRARVTGKL